MLGQDYAQVGWPACGEIDIMENVGFEPATVHGTIHGPGYSGTNGLGTRFSLPSGGFADTFHQLAAEWGPGVVRFYVDNTLYATHSPGFAARRAVGVRRASVLGGPERGRGRHVAWSHPIPQRCVRSRCSWTSCGSTRERLDPRRMARSFRIVTPTALSDHGNRWVPA